MNLKAEDILLNMLEEEEHTDWHALLGRYQVPNPHDGHRMLIQTLLDEGKKVMVILRKDDGTEKNPYSLRERKESFERTYPKEIAEGRMRIVPFWDVQSINYGRGVGYEIRQIELPEEIQKISATDIRNKNK